MTRNAYEIRADLVVMAKEMLDAQYHQNCSFARDAMSRWLDTTGNDGDGFEKYLPKMYTPGEIIAAAMQMQGFVNNGKVENKD